MFRTFPALAVATALLAACGGKPSTRADAADPTAQDAGYLAPPKVDLIRPSTGGGVMVSGAAAEGGQVRLASPAGQASFAPAGAHGRWTMVLPPATEPRIFGLSVTADGRQAQAEGYVLVTPAGQGALLRAGACAQRIDRGGRLGLRTVDFDRGGGLEISAEVAPQATVIVRLDDRQVAEGKADATGRYQVSLGAAGPIRLGAHQIQVFGDGFSDRVAVQTTASAPLAQGPLRSQLTSAGLRVDWMTPGGGVQSTLLIH